MGCAAMLLVVALLACGVNGISLASFGAVSGVNNSVTVAKGNARALEQAMAASSISGQPVVVTAREATQLRIDSVHQLSERIAVAGLQLAQQSRHVAVNSLDHWRPPGSTRSYCVRHGWIGTAKSSAMSPLVFRTPAVRTRRHHHIISL